MTRWVYIVADSSVHVLPRQDWDLIVIHSGRLIIPFQTQAAIDVRGGTVDFCAGELISSEWDTAAGDIKADLLAIHQRHEELAGQPQMMELRCPTCGQPILSTYAAAYCPDCQRNFTAFSMPDHVKQELEEYLNR